MIDMNNQTRHNMEGIGPIMFFCLGWLCGAALSQVTEVPFTTCADLDTAGCSSFYHADPNMCSKPELAFGSCKRFCGNCPVECYSCPTRVDDYGDCNSTVTCGANSTCMTKHLHALDGHTEYILTCESKQMCNGLTVGFGKRHINDVEEIDVAERDLYQRQVILDCCRTDLCNLPDRITTTMEPQTPAPTLASLVLHTSCNKDIVFVVDDSRGTGPANFNHMLDVVGKIVSNITLGGGHNGAHVALMTYSSTPEIQWLLNKYGDAHSVLTALNHVPYHPTANRPDLAMESVLTNVLNHAHGDRKGVPNAVVMITDGHSDVPRLTIKEAAKLQHNVNDVISIGVGSNIDLQELRALATDRHHVFTATSYSNLHKHLSNIIHVLCK